MKRPRLYFEMGPQARWHLDLLSEETRKRYEEWRQLTEAQRQKRLAANPLIQKYDADWRASKLRRAN